MNVSSPAASAVSVDRTHSPLTSGTAIVVYFALVRIVLYFFAAPHYGYFRDELYYLACGEHPAWGYVDQPPLIAWVAWLLQHTIGTSLWALRLLPALAGALTVILAGLLARELGGRRWAMFLASLAALMAPVLLAMSHLFTMNAFDPLLWTAIAYLVVRIARDGSRVSLACSRRTRGDHNPEQICRDLLALGSRHRHLPDAASSEPAPSLVLAGLRPRHSHRGA